MTDRPVHQAKLVLLYRVRSWVDGEIRFLEALLDRPASLRRKGKE